MGKAVNTLSLSTKQRQNAIIEQLQELDLEKKDQNLLFRLEFLGGLFGLLGVGYIYSGLMAAGVLRLLAYSIVVSMTWGLFYTISQMFELVPLFLLPLILQLIISFVSAKELKESFFFARASQMADAQDNDDFIGYIRPATDKMRF